MVPLKKLLIVDDSALMRGHLTRTFTAEGDFQIRLARNGQEAVDENRLFQPDVVTLDINMPVLDGLGALAQIMATRPVPVVMVSSLTERGALATFEALALGAVDYVAKPDGTISLSIEKISAELVRKVRAALRAKPHARPSPRTMVRRIDTGRPPAPERRRSKRGLVLIGVSTGGPSTLETILTGLAADFPDPIVVAQHMPASFTGPFAQRLNGLCDLTVLEVIRPIPLETGTVYIGKGGADIVIAQRSGKYVALPKPESRQHLWHPSVELLGLSALEHFDATSLTAVMLTGMGHDGADAFAEIARRGGRTIAESEDSAVVFGMPKELIARGGAQVVLPCEQIAAQLGTWAREPA
ncbi:MAG: chemotaxis-specific protein-glutamate methyltransferase CheB [Proteobacteria bacterium]|nr:chemotaxis-specific protein-glutamate methyltransferase CheB [Pseudomonadota bacterium]